MKTWLLEKETVGPFQCNCYFLVCVQTGEAVCIDPGDDAAVLLRALKDLEQRLGKVIHVKYLLHTHAHLDHVGATREVKTVLGKCQQEAKIALHKDDLFLYQQLNMQGKLFGMSFEDPLAVEVFLEDKKKMTVGNLLIEVQHTPGHSPGSVCLVCYEKQEKKAPFVIFTGDTLFYESIGRVDLWGGSEAQLLESVFQKVFSLPMETKCLPGHGPETFLGHEKEHNPFLKIKK